PGHEIRLPDDVPMVPALFRQSGYHVNNVTVDEFLRSSMDVQADSKSPIAKTDYNFVWKAESTYDSDHWTVRKSGKPFFVQVQLHGGKNRGQAPKSPWLEKVERKLGSVTPTDVVTLPPYLPDDPVMRADWAQYLDTVRYTDWEVGKIVQRLSDAGELDRTVIFFMTDHGISHVRNKQFLYDGGTHIPLIIRGPKVERSKVRTDLVEHIDLATTSLALAGISTPPTMYSRNILAPDYVPRKYVYAARDRADETVDLIRSVRSERWKYIRNGFPSRPYLQPNRYKDGKAIVKTMRSLYAEGKLNAAQSLIMRETRPAEELYDLERDPWELDNLAQSKDHMAVLNEYRVALAEWQSRTNDPGEPESESVYRIETLAPSTAAGRNDGKETYLKNVELMLRWRVERPFQSWK
ncbi:MAG: sulfatase, partial [Planctomycetes bacterium]|nr:sulfatase [Planctomycetota bacterium]